MKNAKVIQSAHGKSREAGVGDSNKLQSYELGQDDNILTAHEKRLMEMFANGGNIDSVALATKTSSNTIRTHLKRVYFKLDVHTRAEAVAKCIRKGLIE